MNFTISLICLFSIFNFFRLAHSWCFENSFSTNTNVVEMTVSPSNRHLAVLDSNNLVSIYHTSNYQLLATYSMGTQINVIRWSPDGNHLAVAGQDDKVRFLQGYQTFATTKTFDGEVGNRIHGFDFSQDSSNFITCGSSNVTGSNKLTLFTILGNGTWINSTLNLNPSQTAEDCRISHFNDMIAVNTGSEILIYDMTLSQVDSINPPSVTFHKFLFHPLTYSIQYIDSKHDQFVYRDVSSPSQKIFPDTNGPLNDFDITPNANYYATGGNDGDVFIYNSTRDLILTHSIGSTIKSLAFSMVPQRPKLFVADVSGRISILALNCTPQCARDYYMSNSQCLLCSDSLPKCLMCLSPSVCDQCLDGYHVHPNSYSCTSCSMFGCLSCINSGYCTTCQQGFYITGNKCKRCAQSLEGCAICDSATVCIACNNDYFLDEVNNVCKNCSTVAANCLKCMNSTDCTLCTTGYFLASGTCSPCTLLCLSCQNTAQNCSQCLKGYFLSSNTCTPCPSNCLSCNNTQFCFECITSMYQITDGTCASCVHPCKSCQNTTFCYGCHQGYYLDTGVCYLCPANCSTCNSTAYCASCLAGYYVVLPSYTCRACNLQYPNCEYCTGSACEMCQPGYFLNASTLCQHCSERMFMCERCLNLLACSSCYEGYFLTGLAGNFSCRSCQDGCQLCWNSFDCRVCYKNFYLDPNLDCKSCISNCLQCTNSSSCQVCDTGYYLDPAPQTCKLCQVNLTNCVQCSNGSACINCEIGYYLNLANGKCLKCEQYCLTCNSTSCYTCVNGYFLSFTAGNYVCAQCDQNCAECRSLLLCDSCKSGFYLDTATFKCINCSILRNCRTCNNVTCFSCLNGYHLDNNNGASPNYICQNCLLSIQACIECNSTANCFACENSYFLDPVTKKCHYCSVGIDGCQDCINSTNCQTCSPGFYLTANSSCDTCAQGCATCTSAVICTSCTSKYYLLSQKCLPCHKSLQGCLICSSASICKQCMNGFYLASQKCTPCHSTLGGCLYCNNSATCVKCQNAFYLDVSTNKCVFCQKQIAGCMYCSSGSTCLQCESTYFLASGGVGCTFCQSVLPGCLLCKNPTVCQICFSGFSLHPDNTCRTCQSYNTGCQRCTFNSTTLQCVRCSSGYFLSPSLKRCQPCQTVGCQICHESNPDQCVTCDSGYFKNGTHCVNCSSVIQGCNLCASDSLCTACDVGYFVDVSSRCSLCNQQMLGCGKCSLVSSVLECISCKSLYLLDLHTKSCIPCSQLLDGCSYCVNALQCISCTNGYYKNLTTNLCVACTTLTGCFLCESQTACSFCASTYHLSPSKSCTLCNDSIPFCITCISETQCTTCLTGYELRNNKSKCQKYIIQAKDNPKDIKLVTEYVDENTLKHELMLRVGEFSGEGDVNDVKDMCELYLTDYKELRSTESDRAIKHIPLAIKSVAYLSPSTLQFITNNPTSSLLTNRLLLDESASLHTSRRLLEESVTKKLLQNFKVSLEMEKDLIHKILPDIDQKHSLVIDYPLDKSEFYSSYLKHYSSEYEWLKFFGYGALALTLLNFICKTVKVQKIDETNSHFTGETICHMVAIKTVGTFFQHADERTFFFSQGFMLLDLPWANSAISSVLANRADHAPSIMSMYYTNMNLASTSLLSLAAFAVLISLSLLFSDKKQLTNKSKYRQLVYNAFAFTLTYAGSLSVQGSILNPISVLSVNSLFYLAGIAVYVLVVGEIVWSIKKQAKHFYKVRVLVKATMLSFSHVNPITVVILAVMLDLVLMLGIYCIVDTNKPNWVFLSFVNHALLNAVLIIMLVMPSELICIYASMALISAVIIIEFLLNCKLIQYFEQNPHASSCCNWSFQKSSVVSRINGRSKVRVQPIERQQDSQQTIIDGNGQAGADKKLRLEKMWQLQPGDIQIQIGGIVLKQEMTQQVYTRYKQNMKGGQFNASGLSVVSSDSIPAIEANKKRQERRPKDTKFIKAITNKVNMRPKIQTKKPQE